MATPQNVPVAETSQSLPRLPFRAALLLIAAGTLTAGGCSEGSVEVEMEECTLEVSLSETSVSVEVGESRTVTASIDQSACSGVSSVWSSNQDATATVTSGGRITGVSPGPAFVTFTATASDGTRASGSVAVTVVEPPPPPVATVTVSPSPASVAEGETITLTARTFAADGTELTDREVTWSTEDAQLATVSSDGVVTGRVEGVVAITATSEFQTGVSLVTVSPGPAELIHRWSFQEAGGPGTTFQDDEGGREARLVGLGHNAGIGTGEAVVLRGGPRGSSDFVDLGDELLSGLTDATIEIWARPIQVQRWSRIFDFGSGTDNYLTMAWTRGENPGSDLIEWVGNGEKTTANASLAPYELGREYHIVMTIEGTRSDGMTRVRLYKDGVFEGAFSTSLTLADLEDTNMALGQSQFGADHTASASYNELRIYDGVLSAAEIASNTANPPTPLPPVEPYGFVLGAGTFDGHGQGGNLAGGSPFTDQCAPGSAIYRFSGQFQASGVVAQLRAHCAPLVFAPEFSPARFRRGDGDQVLPTHGSNTGQPFDLVCPQNQFVRGLHVHTSSGGVHSFTIFCAEFEVEQQSDPPFYRVDWGATFLLGEGQAVGTPFGDNNNPPRIIDRYRGRSGNRMDAVGIGHIEILLIIG